MELNKIKSVNALGVGLMQPYKKYYKTAKYIKDLFFLAAAVAAIAL